MNPRDLLSALTTFTMAATLLSPLATGCVEPDDADPDLGEDELAISGNPLNGGNGSIVLSGVMRLDIIGDTRVRTGVQIGPDLVMTSSRWVTATTPPSNITVSNGTTNGTNVQSRQAIYVTVNPYLPVAIIQTAQAFATAPVVSDTRTAAQLVAAGQAVNCMAYRTGADFRRAGQESRRTDGAREWIVGPPLGLSTRLDDWDAGAPCFDAINNTFVGFALSSPGNNETRLFGTSHIEFFLAGMRRVASTRRNLNWAQPFMVQTIAPSGSKMCLDVAWGSPYDHAGLNQYGCHGGLNQRWLLDHTHPTGPAFINIMTGSCIDVPGASTTAGQAMQMFGCHSGANQGWVSNGNAASLPGDLLSPLSSPTIWTANGQRPTLCLAVRGGASNSSVPVEQAACNINAAGQDWYLGYAL